MTNTNNAAPTVTLRLMRLICGTWAICQVSDIEIAGSEYSSIQRKWIKPAIVSRFSSSLCWDQAVAWAKDLGVS
jgi:hypothetical protein